MTRLTNKAIFFSAIIVLFANCKNKTNNNNCKKYMTGDIRVDSIYAGSDSLLIRYLNECNAIQKEEQLQKNVKDSFVKNGFQKQYFPNGKLEVLANFKNGIKDSIAVFYYPTGKTKAEEYFMNGQLFGKSTYYDSTGKIDVVQYSVNNDTAWLKASFDANRNVKSFDGGLFYTMFRGKPIQGEKNRLIVLVPEFDNTKTELKVKCNKNGLIIVDTVTNNFIHELNSSFFYYDIEDPQLGEYDFKIEVSIIDKLSNKIIKSDTLSHKLKIS